MAAIFAASSQPALPAAAEHVWDKLLHGGAYGVLGALVLRGLSGRWRRPVSIRMAATAVLMAALYGASDEVHQHFVPPRQMDARDAVADTAGAALAGAALYGWSASARRRPTKAAIISSRDGL
jgi:VanZ family protein